MSMSGIDASQISAMLTQIRAMAAQTQMPVTPQPAVSGTGQANFSDVLKASLDQVNQVQQQADQLGERFAAGDDTVSLSQTMIAVQKANISFQEAVQVRDKLVSAYTTMMNMQV